jgi:hypothetical protein
MIKIFAFMMIYYNTRTDYCKLILTRHFYFIFFSATQ